MRVDYGKTADDYVRYRPGFPPQLYERLRAIGVGSPGQRILDLGTGTGTLARTFATSGCQVTGVDPSMELLVASRELDRRNEVSVNYVNSVAEATGLADRSFDCATAGVCWHWFDADRAALEIRRVLTPGGCLAIIHFDWCATPGSVVTDTEELIRRRLTGSFGRNAVRSAFFALTRKIKPEWVTGEGSGIHPDRMVTLQRNGFERIESFSFDAMIPYTHEAWRGRIRSHAQLGASRNPEIVRQLDAELASMLRERHPQDPLNVTHRVFVVAGRTPTT